MCVDAVQALDMQFGKLLHVIWSSGNLDQKKWIFFWFYSSGEKSDRCSSAAGKLQGNQKSFSGRTSSDRQANVSVQRKS